jgi:hypothetical protein
VFLLRIGTVKNSNNLLVGFWPDISNDRWNLGRFGFVDDQRRLWPAAGYRRALPLVEWAGPRLVQRTKRKIKHV